MLETADSQFVCVEVLSGDVAGRDIEIDYTVEDNGKNHSYMTIAFVKIKDYCIMIHIEFLSLYRS